MKVYADTNFFTNLFLDLSHRDEAKALLEEFEREFETTVPVTPLHWVEI